MTTTRTGDVLAAYGKVHDTIGLAEFRLCRARSQLELVIAFAEAADASIHDLRLVASHLTMALDDLAELPHLVLALEGTAHACGVSHAQEHRPRHLARG